LDVSLFFSMIARINRSGK